MSQIPNIELIAAIVSITAIALGWLFKNLIWNPVKKAWTSIRTDVTTILAHLTDAEKENIIIKNELKKHDEKFVVTDGILKDYGERIEIVEDWTRNTTLKHNEEHPAAKLKLI